jgi:2-polyprenyl-6-methoxyphenol hydroxylase-like FAD-dependent oxidoreductase
VTDIGVVGAGIAGLQFGLLLQQRGITATIYADRTAAQMRAARLPALVARFGPTRERERALGVNHWDSPDFGIFAAHVYIGGPQPLAFCGDFAQPGIAVDMRVYCATLLEDFAARGGRIVIGSVDTDDVRRLAAAHDLVVVASGRASLTGLFPRLPEHSPYSEPQRFLCAGLFRGITYADPLGVSFAISPGAGEIFDVPILSFAGRQSGLFVEAIPGGPLEAAARASCTDDPARFERTLLGVIREHAPQLFARIDPDAFALTRPLDLLQGAITPTVRRGYARFDGGYAMALGDVHVVNDPLLGQGANAASRAAWALGEAIIGGGPYDEAFCQRAERHLWEGARAATAWTNAMLQPPPPHAIGLFVAAAQEKAVADALVDNFAVPERAWDAFSSPDGAAAFLPRHSALQAVPAS